MMNSYVAVENPSKKVLTISTAGQRLKTEIWVMNHIAIRQWQNWPFKRGYKCYPDQTNVLILRTCQQWTSWNSVYFNAFVHKPMKSFFTTTFRL